MKLLRLVLEKNLKIFLATNSERRIELFKKLSLPFEIINNHKNFDERYPQGLSGREISLFLAEKKADFNIEYIKDNKSVLITADTLVVLGKKIIGKPTTKQEAIFMLKELSNKKHTVYTGVCLTTFNKKIKFSVKSYVTFDKLLLEDIEYYVNKFEPLDKAGAYGIQDLIGLIGVKKIEGCFFNVMGLPVNRLYKELLLLAKKI